MDMSCEPRVGKQNVTSLLDDIEIGIGELEDKLHPVLSPQVPSQSSQDEPSSEVICKLKQIIIRLKYLSNRIDL